MLRPRWQLLRFLWLLPALGCGPETTTSSSTDATAGSTETTDASSDTSDGETTSAMLCTPNGYSMCTIPAECSDAQTCNRCGDWFFDEDGCPRPPCTTTADCATDSKCVELTTGLNHHCYHHEGRCECGGDPQSAVNRYCVADDCPQEAIE
ncbi:MAG: hypothetical protein KC636_04850 [Myxococcales bacterium]|nr:hypothetical protein [Myxococcales bacterium]